MDAPAGRGATEVLASLIGTWRGRGTVWLPSMAPRDYDEEIRFATRSPMSLDYWQRAVDVVDGTMLHSEAGIWRVTTAGSLEVSVALPGGTEVSEGTIDDAVISTASMAIGRSATGARLVATIRRYELRPDSIAYEIEIATESFPSSGHLRAELTRTDRPG